MLEGNSKSTKQKTWKNIQRYFQKDETFVETGSFYVFKRKKFLQTGNRIFGKIGLYKTPANEMFDIDTLTDFSVCESLLSTNSPNKNFAA